MFGMIYGSPLPSHKAPPNSAVVSPIVNGKKKSKSQIELESPSLLSLPPLSLSTSQDSTLVTPMPTPTMPQREISIYSSSSNPEASSPKLKTPSSQASSIKTSANTSPLLKMSAPLSLSSSPITRLNRFSSMPNLPPITNLQALQLSEESQTNNKIVRPDTPPPWVVSKQSSVFEEQ